MCLLNTCQSAKVGLATPSGAIDDAATDVVSDSLAAEDSAACTPLGGLLSGPLPPLEAGTCVNGWLASEPRCPCDISGFLTYCPVVGARCFLPADGPGTTSTDQECESQPNGQPIWQQYRLYTPAEFAALPNEIVLDTSDCASRSSAPCSCLPGEPTESWILSHLALTQCTYGNPETYLAFNDAGCVSRVRYGNESAPTADFESCLRSALASRRWDCASSGTHVLDAQTVRPLGGP